MPPSLRSGWVSTIPVDPRELARTPGRDPCGIDRIHQAQIVFDDSTNSHSDWYAEVNVNLRGAAHSITLAQPFFDSSTYGNDSRAGTLIHEVSHFRDVLDTDDNADGRRLPAIGAAGAAT